MSDPYGILGVSRDATDEQIKIAFRKLAMQHHPDRNPGDPNSENKFKEINAAYDAIKNGDKRAAHGRSTHQQQHPQHPFGFGGGPFGFSSGSGGGSPFGFEFNFGDMGDFFREFNPQGHPQNRSFDTHCSISLKDAFKGCDINLKLSDNREIRIKVPAGIEGGTKIRVQHGGENVHPNSPPGDLFVVIQVNEDVTYSRNKQNLFSTEKVNVFDAILGTTIAVSTIDGEVLNIDLPSGAQHNHKIHIAGKGMPILGTPNRGDHIVNIELLFPQLTDEQIDLVKQIKSL